MRRDERLRFCKMCMHRKMDLKQGLICGLTDRSASFEGNCKEFQKDEVEAAKIVKRVYQEKEVESESSGTWTYVVITLVIIRIVLRLMRH